MKKQEIDMEEILENLIMIDYDKDKHCFIFVKEDDSSIEAYLK